MSEEQSTEQEKINQEKFERGYNWGYMLAELEPEMAKDLSEIDSNAPIINGIRAGKETYELEQKAKENSKLPDWLQKDRLTKVFNEHDKGKEVDKDMEPDK